MEQRKTISASNYQIAGLFGDLDQNIIKLEKNFAVKIVNRGDEIVISGERAEQAETVIRKLLSMMSNGVALDEQQVNYVIESVGSNDDFEKLETINSDVVCMTIGGRPIKPKTLGQKKYVEQIRQNTIVFGIGPAGTGKTYLAMAMAINALKRNEVSRIILTRPAIEAGERLGFLPGDLQQKVDPYLRPLYDALHEIMGPETFQKHMEKGVIEVAPLAYMRGRTLDNSFIVLDEAQNTTPEQMKMFLTRLGFNSRIVVTGDITQIDLPDGKKSGLKEAARILEGVEGIGFTYLTNRDVVRHPLVQRIIKAYEKNEAKTEYKKKRVMRVKNKGQQSKK